MGEFLQRLSTAATLEDLTTLCDEQARALGFDHFVYALRVPTNFSGARLIVLDGYPDGWVDRYMRQSLHAWDPVVAHCAVHVAPVYWGDLSVARGSPAARVMGEASDFGLRGGVSMPVHSPHGEQGILSMTTQGRSACAREMERRAMPHVQLMATYLHEAVRRVSGLAGDDRQPLLNGREAECLRWAADGKTSSEIGQVLGLAESTVNFHLNGAMRKLGVGSRQQAVARAALRGWIKPHPF